jgi:hypothetical protein
MPFAATASATIRSSGRWRFHGSKTSNTSGVVPVTSMKRSRSARVGVERPRTGVRTTRGSAGADGVADGAADDGPVAVGAAASVPSCTAPEATTM